jgi:hypothetical protein
MDYSHRLFGAHITISAGPKNLTFRSYNKTRLRKLINHVQHCIAKLKMQQSQHQEGQNQHLEQINQQLQTYLMAQYQNQLMLNQRLQEVSSSSEKEATASAQPYIVKPSPELSDYLFAQGLLRQHEQEIVQQTEAQVMVPSTTIPQEAQASISTEPSIPEPAQAPADQSMEDLYQAGQQEIFGKYRQGKSLSIPRPKLILDGNPMKIAYSKLHWALSLRKRFGREGGSNGGVNKNAIPVQP